MTSAEQLLQNKLDSAALVIRRYNLGDSGYFINKFSFIDKTILDNAWAYSLKEVQSKKIVKDASTIDENQAKIANDKFYQFKRDTHSIYLYLNRNFDPQTLKLTDENIERRLRHKLALLYISSTHAEIAELNIQLKPTFKKRIRIFFSRYKAAIVVLGVIMAFLTPRIIKGLTPVNVLAERIHEKSKRKFNGAVCRDGHISHSQGRGTCSWHNGVNYYFYKGAYTKTMDECIEEAKKLSWRD